MLTLSILSNYGHSSGRIPIYFLFGETFHCVLCVSFNSMLISMTIIQALARILYQAAGDGYVDRNKVEQILHVKPHEMTGKMEHFQTDQTLETETSGRNSLIKKILFSVLDRKAP